MTLQLDSVEISTPDLEGATAAYRLLLDVEPVLRGGARRFPLGRGAIELVAGDGERRTLRFLGDDPALALPASFHGLTVRVDPPEERAAPSGGPVLGIDHVVVQTVDPERAIALWRDGLGLRLALDRAFAERGLRLLFFRSGGITLEYASPHPPATGTGAGDCLHGISYRVANLVAQRERLLGAGIDVSPIRSGMRRGTSVMTIRSGTANVPTLMLAEDLPAGG